MSEWGHTLVHHVLLRIIVAWCVASVLQVVSPWHGAGGEGRQRTETAASHASARNDM